MIERVLNKLKYGIPLTDLELKVLSVVPDTPVANNFSLTEDIAESLGLSLRKTRAILRQLLAKGFVDAVPYYELTLWTSWPTHEKMGLGPNEDLREVLKEREAMAREHARVRRD